jgi:hypothetical protein
MPEGGRKGLTPSCALTRVRPLAAALAQSKLIGKLHVVKTIFGGFQFHLTSRIPPLILTTFSTITVQVALYPFISLFPNQFDSFILHLL